jgi:hypothetical protein
MALASTFDNPPGLPIVRQIKATSDARDAWYRRDKLTSERRGTRFGARCETSTGPWQHQRPGLLCPPKPTMPNAD